MPLKKTDLDFYLAYDLENSENAQLAERVRSALRHLGGEKRHNRPIDYIPTSLTQEDLDFVESYSTDDVLDVHRVDGILEALRRMANNKLR